LSAQKAAASAKTKSGPERLLIGAHMSISGGVELAPLRGREVGCACLQIFTKSNMQWAARPLGDEEIAAFKRNCQEVLERACTPQEKAAFAEAELKYEEMKARVVALTAEYRNATDSWVNSDAVARAIADYRRTTAHK